MARCRKLDRHRAAYCLTRLGVSRLGLTNLRVLFSVMRIEKLVIPTPFPVGPINIYMVVDDPITLVDTGPKTDQAVATLREQLGKLGFKTEDVKRIVLTHTHEDHCGLAGTLQRESGARVYVHEWESQNISDRRRTRVDPDLLKRAGAPGEEL